MSTLYLDMTAKLTEHWKANSNSYPQKFVLTPTQGDEYVKCLSWMTDERSRVSTIPEKHMGVSIEISESTPGVMIAADGAEIPLLAQPA